MDAWQILPLGDALTFQRGFDITKDEQCDGPYPVISSSGPKSNHTDFKVRGPGVIIGRKGSLGTVFYSDGNFWPHDTTLWVKDFHGNHPRFAYYFLQTMGFERLDAGASNPSLNRNHIHTILVSWPSLPTQRRIASILSAYDDLIENCQRRIKILETMARALYREWFVNFRFPGHEKVKMVQSKMGKIPEGWEVKMLGEICIVTDYVANGSFATLKENVKYRDEPDFAILIRGTDFNSGWNGKYVHVTEGSYRFLRKSELRPGDIVVTNVGNVGITFFVPDLGKPMTLGPNSVLVRPYLGTNFVFHYLRSDEGQHRIRGITSGVAQPKFNKTEFRTLNLATPPNNLLQQFDKVVTPIHAMSDKLRENCANLRRTRDLLLPRLLSSQVNLKAN